MGTINIRLGGDVMLGGSVLDQIRQNGPAFPFVELIANRGNEDIFFCNLECTLTANNKPLDPNRTNLHSIPEAAEGLSQTGFNVISLANNHAFDFGLDDFRSTQQILNYHNIHSVGGGESYAEASQAIVLQQGECKVAFLAYCTPDTGCQKFATDNNYGVADPATENLANKISQVKEESDIVIVSLHWGNEFHDYPAPPDIQLARTLIDHGATIVIGHHSHVFQGYERYKRGVILYDLGSVVFGDIIRKYYKFYLKNRKHREGILVDCCVDHEGVKEVSFVPTWINTNFQATVPSTLDARRILERWEEQSQAITSDNYEAFYLSYMKKQRVARSWAEFKRLATNPRCLFRGGVRSFSRRLINKFAS